MMKEASGIPMLLLLATTLLCGCPTATHAYAMQDLSEKDAEILDTLYQRFYSAFVQNAQPSPPPTFEAIAAGAENAHHSISPDKFKIGYVVEGTYSSPNKGIVTFNLWNDPKEEVILHVTIRYDYPGEYHVLVLNTFSGGAWGPEVRPSGFDFTASIPVKVRIEALQDKFRVTANGKEISLFAYRPNLTPDKVTRIEWSYQDYNADPKADLKSLSIHY